MLKTHTPKATHQTSFFDSLITDALKTYPLLLKVDYILNQIPDFIQPFVKVYEEDRQKRNVRNDFGRSTIPIESVVRLLTLKQLHKDCSLRDVEQRTKTDYAWKGFAQLSLTDKVPDHSTLGLWEQFFGEESLKKLHDKIINYCLDKKIIKGRKFQTDTTVAEANTHYPTDSSLLGDAVRVITRTIEKIKKVVKLKTVFHSKTKKVKVKIRDINNSLKKRSGKAKQTVKTATREIADIAGRSVKQAGRVLDELSKKAQANAQAMAEKLAQQLALAQQIISQTYDVLDGQKISNRIVSFFQPSMRPIQKGKLSVKCEFGQKLQIDEVENKIISNWRLFGGNPNDATLLIPAIDKHKHRFGRDPTVAATDRGFDSEDNQAKLKNRIKRLSIPKRGYKSKQRLRTERSKWFQKAQNWRAGGEGTISVLKRTSSIGKNKAKTETSYTQAIAWGVIGRNLKTMTAYV